MLRSLKELTASVEAIKEEIVKLVEEQEKDEVESHRQQAAHHYDEYQTKSCELETKENEIQYNIVIEKNIMQQLELSKLEALLQNQDTECFEGDVDDDFLSEITQTELAALITERECVDTHAKEVRSQINVANGKISALQQEYDNIMLEYKEEQKPIENYRKLLKYECLTKKIN